MNNNDLERYGRHILLPQIDYEGQQKLIESHVMVIGLGGLGSPASIYLASSGIGRLTICDFDKVELSNLQRQILFNEKNIDTNKAQSAKINLSRINSSIKIDSIDFKLTEEKLSDYLKTNCVDVVVDCSDNFLTRYAINKIAYQNKVAVVSGSAIKFEGQLVSFDFKNMNTGCYECIFPNTGEEDELRCEDHGVLSPLVGAIGAMQALEVIKIILQLNPLKNKFLIFDGLNNEWKTISFKQDKACKICKRPND